MGSRKHSNENEDYTNLSRQVLKCHSGEFDIESIHNLNLRNRGVANLGHISECCNLGNLDISINDIGRLDPLVGLLNLTVLNVSANRITSLEPLQHLDSLVNLNVAGNLIGSMESVKVLRSLEKFQELRLQDTVRDLTNPICSHVQYKTKCLEYLPYLRVLDGCILSGPGSELSSLCDRLDSLLQDRKLNRRVDVEVPLSEPWFRNNFWQIPEDEEADADISRNVNQFQEELEECKKLNTDMKKQCVTTQQPS